MGNLEAPVIGLLAGLVIVAVVLIVGSLRFGSQQRAQQEVLRRRFPGSVMFASYAINALRNHVTLMHALLQRPGIVQGLSVTSPTVTADADGLTIWYGGRDPQVAFTAPRSVIVGVGSDLLREGIYRYPVVVVLLDTPAGPGPLPLPVSRNESPMRRATPEAAEALARELAALWGVPMVPTPPK